MSTRSKLVKNLQHFLSEEDMEASELGWRAARNSNLVDKLLSGGDCTTRIMDQLYDYMDRHRNYKPKEHSNEHHNENC